ncbi:unnamed protein product [Acanthosepion pharaonis]|uniref:Uncharacterized protein n=1 Tax=Acanthosepion pharaonis TaxID=158019 RepID=A0A812DAQ2_ACAPH|nr:unnamed protein product [Sepia pharaonis]
MIHFLLSLLSTDLLITYPYFRLSFQSVGDRNHFKYVSIADITHFPRLFVKQFLTTFTTLFLSITFLSHSFLTLLLSVTLSITIFFSSYLFFYLLPHSFLTVILFITLLPHFFFFFLFCLFYCLFSGSRFIYRSIYYLTFFFFSFYLSIYPFSDFRSIYLLSH